MSRLSIKHTATWALSKVPAIFLKQFIGAKSIIPYYHVVSNTKLPHICHLYQYKNVKQFIDDIDFLLKNFKPVSMYDLLESLKGDRILPSRSFLLTFDDGLRELYDIVAPILQRKGITATFFINTAFMNNKILFHKHKASILIEHILNRENSKTEDRIRKIYKEYGIPFSSLFESVMILINQDNEIIDNIALKLDVDFNDYLSQNRPYLTAHQINELINKGFTIGAHSLDHPLYADLSLEEQLRQTIQSTSIIRDQFSLNYGVFAFPYTDNQVSDSFFSRLKNIEFIDITFGTGGMNKMDSYPHFQRLSFEKPCKPAKDILSLHVAKRILHSFKLNRSFDTII